MLLLDLDQGSPEWLRARLGIPTASRFKDIITPARGEPSKSSRRYLYELLAERLTGEPSEGFTSEWMQRGNELEPQARAAYEFLQEIEMKQTGIMLNDAATIGASPDGLIGEDGGLEIKCPKPATMIEYMLADAVPSVYQPQIQGCLWISGREWWDFVAYHPSMDLFVKRVYRDKLFIEKLEEHITAFVRDLEAAHRKINHEL